MRARLRVVVLVAAAAVLVIGFVLANGSGPAKPRAAAERRFEVVVTGGKPAGGVKQLDAYKGDTINLKVSSTVADEIHIHGYDLHMAVKAGGAAEFQFTARIDGTFVIELESRSEQIAALTVRT